MRRRLIGLAVALGGLAVVGDALAVDAETRKLARSDDWSERTDAAILLATEGTPEAVKLLRKLLTDDQPYVRDWSVYYCDRLKNEAGIAALEPLTRSRHEWARLNCASALGRTESPFAAPLLTQITLNDRSAGVRAAAMTGLVQLKKQVDVDSVLMEAFQNTDADVRAAAVVAQDKLRGASAKVMALAACDDPDEGVRCVGTWLLRRVDRSALLARLGQTHKGDRWRSRVQLAENATFLRARESIDVLVALLDDANPRVASQAHRGLRRLSGTRLGRDRDLWDSWWKANRAGWTVTKEMPPAPSVEAGDTFARYHGMEVDSAGVLFVLDASASMYGRLDEDATEGPSRWELATTELFATLDQLPDGLPVNVARFHEDAKAAFPTPRALSKSTRKALRAFIEGTELEAATNLYSALRLTLRMKGIDTVFILSDGDSTHGEIVRDDRIAPIFWRANRSRKLAVHTIAFGADQSGSELLTRLATNNGGRLVKK